MYLLGQRIFFQNCFPRFVFPNQCRNTPWQSLLYKGWKVSGLRTTNCHHINPVLALLLKSKGIKILKGASVVAGRTLRKTHVKLPPHIQHIITRHNISFTIISFAFIYIFHYSWKHYDASPITGRKRWISFTKEQILILADSNYKDMLNQYGSKLLDESSPIFRECAKLTNMLVKCNADIDIVKTMPWHLNVVDDNDINNAFVLPNGEIFVFTGMLQLMSSWEELAIVLGHEMAHAILGHAQVGFAVCLSYFLMFKMTCKTFNIL